MANSYNNDGSFMNQFLQHDKKDGQQASSQQQALNSQPTDADLASHDPYYQYSGYYPYAQQTQQYYYGYGYNPYAQVSPVYPPQPQPPQPQPFNRQPPPPQSMSPQSAQAAINKPSRSLWIGNIHPETTDQELRADFGGFGFIESVKILPHKSCAFVNYMDINSALAAHSTYGVGKFIHGQEIRIGWGRIEFTEREEGPKSKNLWIGNIGPEVSDDMIREKFSHYGHIDSIKILAHKNCAFVNYTDMESAVAAKRDLYGVLLSGRPMKINYGRVETPPNVIGPLGVMSGIGVTGPGVTGMGGMGMVLQGPQYGSSDDNPLGLTTTTGSNMPSSSNASAGFPLLKKTVGKKEEETPEEQFDFVGVEPSPPPLDDTLKSVIDKMADYVSRNGPAFERLMKEKEKKNPRLSFLFGGPDHKYYRWKLFTLTQNYEEMSAPLSKQEKEELLTKIRQLNGNKDSIKRGKEWIVSKKNQSVEIINILRHEVENNISAFEDKLHVLYLISDVLHHALGLRSDIGTLDHISKSFKQPLVFILRAAYHDQDQKHQEMVIQLLHLWASRNIYPSETIQKIEEAVTSPDQPAEPPHTLSSPSHIISKKEEKNSDSAYPNAAYNEFSPPASYYANNSSSSTSSSSSSSTNNSIDSLVVVGMKNAVDMLTKNNPNNQQNIVVNYSNALAMGSSETEGGSNSSKGKPEDDSRPSKEDKTNEEEEENEDENEEGSYRDEKRTERKRHRDEESSSSSSSKRDKEHSDDSDRKRRRRDRKSGWD